MSLGDKIPPSAKMLLTGIALLTATAFSGCNGKEIKTVVNLDGKDGPDRVITTPRPLGGITVATSLYAGKDSKGRTAVYTVPTIVYEGKGDSATVNDANGDGMPDIIIKRENGEVIAMLYGNPNGPYTTGTYSTNQ